MQQLNSVTFPLTGPSLIEASAGTGKTYTIVNLYLRLLLGDGCEPHDIENILVVTFTKAATAELRERIRARLHDAYMAFYADKLDNVNDEVLHHLIHHCQDKGMALRRLNLAIRQMDEAAVFTIHSFCQRMLSEHAFESGANYDVDMVMDESQWVELAVNDYWRREIAPQDTHWIEMVMSVFNSPDQLRQTLRPLLYRSVRIDDAHDVMQLEHNVKEYVHAVKRFKLWWLNANLSAKLLEAGLKKNHSVGKAAFHEKILAFCQSDDIVPQFSSAPSWESITSDKIQKALPKTLDKPLDIDFTVIDDLHLTLTSIQRALKPSIIAHAQHAVSQLLADIKQRLSLIAPDDLLRVLHDALRHPQTGKKLAEAIRQSYPAALIDEFQDTDAIQFSIFESLYLSLQSGSPQDNDNHRLINEIPVDAPNMTSPCCFIMIGDPKQAIYAFRGADIFTYIQAKRCLSEERLFTLTKNYRTQSSLVHSVNHIFARQKNAFMMDADIPFMPVQAHQSETAITIGNKRLNALTFRHLRSDTDKPLSWSEASVIMATDAALQVKELLTLNAMVAERAIRAGDCCMLVRDRQEATLLRTALRQQGIDSVFQVRQSVFSSTVARDLYLLLHAIANPAEEQALRAVFCSSLFVMDAAEIDALFSDEKRWQAVLDQCYSWQKSWLRYGIMHTVMQVCEQFDVFRRNVMHFEDGQRRVTDLRHVTELLQEQHAKTPSMSQVLHWFSEHLHEPDDNHEAQQIRLETDENLVQIVTMHSAKGLEYPVVFIPFACRAREANNALYHDANHALRADLNNQEARLALAESERLAEDIRLLYVALTRAVYHCSVGIWNPGDRKKQSVFTRSALGALLIQEHCAMNDTDNVDDGVLAKAIMALVEAKSSNTMDLSDTAYHQIDPSAMAQAPHVTARNDKGSDKSALALSTVTRHNLQTWRLASYSSISKQRQEIEHHTLLPGRDEGERDIEPQKPSVDIDALPTRFAFEKGAQAGSFLHGVLEHCTFNSLDNLPDIVAQQSQWFGIDEEWHIKLVDWITEVLNTPLTGALCDAKLSDLPATHILPEMEFHLPMKQVKEAQFNHILNQFMPGKAKYYRFQEINGMLKGFIDLTFCHQNQYYVADYKSNHLGYHFDDYTQDNLEAAMDDHDYHLQAILYSLAMHRWLRRKLVNYDYDTHFGGAYYLFLRGMSEAQQGRGVYFSRPEKAFIDALDALFDGEYRPQSSEQEQMSLW
ncbi:exodeoxyribonuclease V subunit beta [Aestuariibacter sp. AA17]|uniref:RecBCD enzyme subunit RecB n=1 Tax=Fluctibacter corallii TaxID=2984329 RepID=A0ABT3A9C5_9ALTE|nr:exodeoxyribonuclease V subunit beta [Aestuariibacter sp. AA17]MCV2885204.1 exodeoxyribonuclease V subunit beta [Aestuariibacter sp. AA17]